MVVRWLGIDDSMVLLKKRESEMVAIGERVLVLSLLNPGEKERGGEGT